MDGMLIANNKADLTDGTIANPINLDEYGTNISVGYAWTGTFSSGFADTVDNCNSWTSGSVSVYGRWGDANRVSAGWTDYTADGCQTSGFKLYCFEQ